MSSSSQEANLEGISTLYILLGFIETWCMLFLIKISVPSSGLSNPGFEVAGVKLAALCDLEEGAGVPFGDRCPLITESVTYTVAQSITASKNSRNVISSSRLQKSSCASSGLSFARIVKFGFRLSTRFY